MTIFSFCLPNQVIDFRVINSRQHSKALNYLLTIMRSDRVPFDYHISFASLTIKFYVLQQNCKTTSALKLHLMILQSFFLIAQVCSTRWSLIEIIRVLPGRGNLSRVVNFFFLFYLVTMIRIYEMSSFL